MDASLKASGTFDVTVTPARDNDTVDGVSLGRLTMSKKFFGDIDGTSVGEMLSAGTGVPGSAGYVAIERITAAVHGRTGGFVLQHSGTMTRGAPSLAISVVPDSGTGQLKGMAGEMKIEIIDGKHLFTFNYTLPAD